MDKIFIESKNFIGGGETIHRKYCRLFKHFREDWR